MSLLRTMALCALFLPVGAQAADPEPALEAQAKALADRCHEAATDYRDTTDMWQHAAEEAIKAAKLYTAQLKVKNVAGARGLESWLMETTDRAAQLQPAYEAARHEMYAAEEAAKRFREAHQQIAFPLQPPDRPTERYFEWCFLPL